MGEHYRYNYNMPAKTQQKDFAFGVPNKPSESSKAVIYLPPPVNPHVPVTGDLRDITKPIDRQYNWDHIKNQPNFRFGISTHRPDQGGVAQSLVHSTKTNIGSNRVVNKKRFDGDLLGKSCGFESTKHKVPEGFAYGYVVPGDQWGSKECLQGDYALDQQMPDANLGKCASKTGMPVNTERRFGNPSIRDDIPVPTLKSVAEPRNFGDEYTGQQLLYPAAHAFDGVSQSDFIVDRSKNDIRMVFETIGHTFSDSDFESMCRQVVT